MIDSTKPADPASTKARILDTAEGLFAERGFAETSLRHITSRAQVNLASVNYHFGSKKSLIQAVFDRFLREFLGSLTPGLQRLESQATPATVEELLRVVLPALQHVDALRPEGAAIFMRLLGRAYAETQGHLRRFISERYNAVMQQFVRQIVRACPQLPPTELFWRLHFMLGTVVFTLGGAEALRDIAAADFNEQVSLDAVARKLIPFLAAGLAAPLSSPS